MRPFMGAGGAMAVEDAAVLSRCLREFDDPAEAFSCYESTRISACGGSATHLDREQLDARPNRN